MLDVRSVLLDFDLRIGLSVLQEDNMPLSKPSVTPSSRPAHSAVLLSALVCPGTGQLLQKRWLAGIAFGTSFIACLVVFLVHALRIIFAFYSLAFQFQEYEEKPIPLLRCLIALAAALLIYVAGIIDTYRAHASRSAGA